MPDTQAAPTRGGLSHRIVRMTGRDPNESHRAATPLELLFDLTFVVAFGQAGEQMAHLLAEGHVGAAIGGFAFAMFAICWAWINFTWFASAYDTDDWFFRIATMVEMVGVIVLALGLPTVFHSIDSGDGLGNGVIVAGYVVMRLAMIALWLRVARHDKLRRPTALTYAVVIFAAQVGWVAVALVNPPLNVIALVIGVGVVIEAGGVYLAERKTSGTPWHADHLAERYGLLTIITLGETLFGTVAAVSAIVQEQNWSSEAIAVLTAGVGLSFALWWNYFVLPSGAILHRYRGRVWWWSYGHILIFSAIAATGAGIHVAAYVVDGTAHVGTLGAVLSVAIPVLVYFVALLAIYAYMVHAVDPFHFALVAGVVAVLVAASLVAASGGSLGICLLLVTLSPIIVVVGYETIGHRHEAAVLERALNTPTPEGTRG
jgi:low temperature requirement protein LtrA